MVKFAKKLITHAIERLISTHNKNIDTLTH